MENFALWGSLVNAIGVAGGAVVGVLAAKVTSGAARKRETVETAKGNKLTDAISLALALCVVMIGIGGMLKGAMNDAIMGAMSVLTLPGEKTLVILFSMLIGTVVGTVLDLEDRFERFGAWVEKKFGGQEGGIAKGFTGDRVGEIFSRYNINSGIISLGGNVQAYGTKTNGKPWRVAIQNPESSMEYLGVLDVQDKAVVTSGGYERFFEENGVRYHHIIDPRTGYPADSGLISATIVCEKGILADGLSTSLFIMGKDQAEKYWRSKADKFDYILEDKDGRLYVTEGASGILTTDAEIVVVKK
jgi:uncharacterized membrane protein YqgA involved in biofilm formation